MLLAGLHHSLRYEHRLSSFFIDDMILSYLLYEELVYDYIFTQPYDRTYHGTCKMNVTFKNKIWIMSSQSTEADSAILQNATVARLAHRSIQHQQTQS